MTDTTREAVERLIDRIHESKAGRDLRTDAIATLRAQQAEIARLKAPGEPVSWKSIADAPYDTPLTIRVGGMTFGAILRRGASETTDGDPCDQWQALIADEHPPCWTDGACWEINADGYGSREPEAWRTIAAQTPPEDVGTERAGWNAAIAWVERQLDVYVAECGIYDPETNVTEFPDGGEWEGSIQEIIDGLRLAMPAALAKQGGA